MRKNEKTKTIVIVILAFVVGIWLLNTIITNTVNATGNKDADDYEYGIPLQNVVDLHYMEMNTGFRTSDNYPVYKTISDGWIVYTIHDAHTGERITEVVFYGPEFWDGVKRGNVSDTNNWQE
jgi:hypothetical protein